MNLAIVRRKLPTLGICLFVLSQCWSEASAVGGPKVILGRIVARRTTDNFDVVSFVVNQAYFLFQPANKPGMLLKLSYPHEGYSVLPAEWFGPKSEIKIRIKRSKQCDETFVSFQASSPGLPMIDDSGKQVDKLPGIIWIGSRPAVEPSYKLLCYSLIVGKDSSGH